jgi:hypothetical protein
MSKEVSNCLSLLLYRCIITILFIATQPVQHVVHHYVQHESPETVPGYDQNVYPWSEFRREERPQTPPPFEPRRRVESRRREADEESLDDRLERVREEIRRGGSAKQETNEFVEPTPRVLYVGDDQASRTPSSR